MGSENFNRQFILLDFADLDNPDFLSFTRAPEFSTYLLMRRHIWRSHQPHYMGLHEYFRKGHLACSLDREKIAEWLRLSLVSVSNDITALSRRQVIESLRTGRQNIFVLGRWVEDDGAYFEHFFLDRLYVRSKETLISSLLDGRNKESFTSADNPIDTPDVKKSLHSNREENRAMNREIHKEKGAENSNIRKGTHKNLDVDNSVDRPVNNDLAITPPTKGRVESAITDYISDFAREFNDQAPLSSSVARAVNLYQRAGVDVELFVDMLLQARAATKQHSTRIRKNADAGTPWGGSKNRMAYFFSVVEDKLNLSAKEAER